MYADQAMTEPSGYLGSSQAVSPSLMNSAIKQVHELAEFALQANGTICESRARLFGPQPANGTEKTGLREAPNGLASELTEAIARARAAVLECRENAAALSSAL